MTEKKDSRSLTKRADNFAEWYQEVLAAAELVEHGPVKGTMIIRPYGYALWERIVAELDARIKKTGVKNAYFPLFIPEEFLKREAKHVEGFAPEIAVVTHAGGKKLAEPIVVRPTSETIMYDAFSRWIHSYRDLPLLINQWANVVRWELRPRLFLRSTEFLWQEGHTAHATAMEADTRAREMLVIYENFIREFFAIAVLAGEKSESEKFAGAEKTYTIEAMTQDGHALQLATSHNLGDHFAKVFNINFTDEKGESKNAFQTSWGLSTRTLGGLVMAHGDDKGIVLPPNAAAVQVIVVPIWPNEDMKVAVLQAAGEIIKELISAGVRAECDEREMTFGEKNYYWEKRGVPLRIEIGPKDIAAGCVVFARRDTGEKVEVARSEVVATASNELKRIQDSLYETSLRRLNEGIATVEKWDYFVSAIENGKFVLAHWSGDAAVEKEIKEATGATIRCIPFSEKLEEGVCVKSGKPSSKRVIFAKSY